MRRFVLLGCNHAKASAEEIGRARLPAETAAELLPVVRDRLGAAELVYLSTCHRTEWYLVYDGELCPGRLTMLLGQALCEISRGRSALPAVDRCLTVHGGEVPRHLFRVASALDSLMLGETQVLGQVKDAFRLACEDGVAGPRLTTLFTQAFRTAKRVRTETALSRRPISLVSLAERRLRARLDADAGPVAVLGAGEMAALALELIRKLDADREVTLFNRSQPRGFDLAERYRARFLPLDRLGATGTRFAAIIAATSADDPVVTAPLASLLAPTMLLDLGLPSNVSPECATIAGVELVDQEALHVEADCNRAARAEELMKAEQIVEEQLSELSYEVMEHELSPVARHLLGTFREAARTELERCAGTGGVDAAHLEEAIERLSQRLVRVPMKGLREVAWRHSTDILDTFLRAVGQ